MKVLASLFLLGGLSSCATQPQGSESAAPPSPTDTTFSLSPEVYRLNPGDTVAIRIYQEPDLSGKFVIGPDGAISYPLLGRVPAAKGTIVTLQRRLHKGLTQGYLVDPDIRVTIAGYTPIYVIGQVRRPGKYPFSPGLTAQQAITLAGGPTQFASSKIRIQRHESRPEDSYLISPETRLYPGDTISLSERLF